MQVVVAVPLSSKIYFVLPYGHRNWRTRCVPRLHETLSLTKLGALATNRTCTCRVNSRIMAIPGKTAILKQKHKSK